MKYTIKQVLAFCDAIYKSETETAGGRSGYLMVNAPKKKHINEVTRSTREKFGLPATMAFCAAAIAANLYMLSIEGVNASSITGIAIMLTCIAFCHHLNRKSKNFWAKTKEEWRTYAHWYEPEAIWNLDYPRDNSVKSSLIRSVLGARIFNNKLMQMTAIPMDQKVIDDRVSHLVREIAVSKGNDIHPYLVEEVKSFCRQAVSDMNFYSPIITLQEELEKAELE